MGLLSTCLNCMFSHSCRSHRSAGLEGRLARPQPDAVCSSCLQPLSPNPAACRQGGPVGPQRRSAADDRDGF